jgi:hypothetical protein
VFCASCSLGQYDLRRPLWIIKLFQYCCSNDFCCAWKPGSASIFSHPLNQAFRFISFFVRFYQREIPCCTSGAFAQNVFACVHGLRDYIQSHSDGQIHDLSPSMQREASLRVLTAIFCCFPNAFFGSGVHCFKDRRSTTQSGESQKT